MSQNISGVSTVWNSSFISVKKDVRDVDREIEETPSAVSRKVLKCVLYSVVLSMQHVTVFFTFIALLTE